MKPHIRKVNGLWTMFACRTRTAWPIAVSPSIKGMLRARQIDDLMGRYSEIQYKSFNALARMSGQ